MKNVLFVWDKACHNTFESIKKYLANPTIIGAPMVGKPLILYIAAQECSLRALLAQEKEENKESAIVLLKSNSNAELNYSIIKKTCLTLIFSKKKAKTLYANIHSRLNSTC